MRVPDYKFKCFVSGSVAAVWVTWVPLSSAPRASRKAEQSTSAQCSVLPGPRLRVTKVRLPDNDFLFFRLKTYALPGVLVSHKI